MSNRPASLKFVTAGMRGDLRCNDGSREKTRRADVYIPGQKVLLHSDAKRSRAPRARKDIPQRGTTRPITPLSLCSIARKSCGDPPALLPGTETTCAGYSSITGPLACGPEAQLVTTGQVTDLLLGPSMLAPVDFGMSPSLLNIELQA